RGSASLRCSAFSASALITGSRGEVLDLDVIAKLATEREARAHQQANHRRAVGDFFHHRVIAEAHLAQPRAMRAVRTNVPHTQPLATFRSRESQSVNGREHRWGVNTVGEIGSQVGIAIES